MEVLALAASSLMSLMVIAIGLKSLLIDDFCCSVVLCTAVFVSGLVENVRAYPVEMHVSNGNPGK